MALSAPGRSFARMRALTSAMSARVPLSSAATDSSLAMAELLLPRAISASAMLVRTRVSLGATRAAAA